MNRKNSEFHIKSIDYLIILCQWQFSNLKKTYILYMQKNIRGGGIREIMELYNLLVFCVKLFEILKFIFNKTRFLCPILDRLNPDLQRGHQEHPFFNTFWAVILHTTKQILLNGTCSNPPCKVERESGQLQKKWLLQYHSLVLHCRMGIVLPF